MKAEIVGAGIGGATAALVLASGGWSVTVHESGPELREVGAGLFLKENGIQVLENYGLRSFLAERSVPLALNHMVDGATGNMSTRDWRTLPNGRCCALIRTDLHAALVSAAEAAGASFVTGSKFEGLESNGDYRFSDGRVKPGDLLVGADGVNSNVRAALGLVWREKLFPEANTRALTNLGGLLPSALVGIDEQGVGIYSSFASRNRRVIITPVPDGLFYIDLKSSEKDLLAAKTPIDVSSWSKSFPMLGGVFEAIRGKEVQRRASRGIVTSEWVKGNAALVGDACLAQPPNMGQGAGLAIANASSLGEYVRGATSPFEVVQALEDWQVARLKISKEIQRRSFVQSRLWYGWPEKLMWVRPLVDSIRKMRPGWQKRHDFLWAGGI